MVTGESWKCPHCGEQILRTATVCPACQRRLHVSALASSPASPSAISPLRIDATVPHPGGGAAWEYTVLVEVWNAAGAVLARRVVGVGAVQPGESRGVTLRIDMHPAGRSAPAGAAERLEKPE